MPLSRDIDMDTERQQQAFATLLAGYRAGFVDVSIIQTMRTNPIFAAWLAGRAVEGDPSEWEKALP